LDKKCGFFVLPATQKLVWTTVKKLPVQFHPDFTGVCISSAFTGSYGPLNMFIFFWTTPLLPLMQFQYNFTGLIGSSSMCAYYVDFPVE
jgi:hypothetical protein